MFLKCKVDICRFRKGTKSTGMKLSEYLRANVWFVMGLLLLCRRRPSGSPTHTVTCIAMNINNVSINRKSWGSQNNSHMIWKWSSFSILTVTEHDYSSTKIFGFQPCPPCVKWETLAFWSNFIQDLSVAKSCFSALSSNCPLCKGTVPHPSLGVLVNV